MSAPPEPPPESWDDIAAQLHDLRERGEWAAQLSHHLTPGSPLLEFLAEAGERQMQAASRAGLVLTLTNSAPVTSTPFSWGGPQHHSSITRRSTFMGGQHGGGTGSGQGGSQQDDGQSGAGHGGGGSEGQDSGHSDTKGSGTK